MEISIHGKRRTNARNLTFGFIFYFSCYIKRAEIKIYFEKFPINLICTQEILGGFYNGQANIYMSGSVLKINIILI